MRKWTPRPGLLAGIAGAGAALLVGAGAVRAGPFYAIALPEPGRCSGWFPNCVSSRAPLQSSRYVAPFYIVPPDDGVLLPEALDRSFTQVQRLVRSSQTRVRVIGSTPDALHMIVKSRVFGFPDEIRLALVRRSRRVDVQSSAALFPLDFGVNRTRVERLREQLQAAGLIE